jgi:hypothetical protein
MAKANWLTTAVFADLYGITDRQARRIAKTSKGGLTWRGLDLISRVIAGRGGQRGQQYEIGIVTASMPGQSKLLQAPLSAPSMAPQLPVAIEPVRYAVPALSDRDKACAQMRERLAMIEDAMAHPPRSPERTAELERAAAKHKVTLRTLQRWIRNVEECGGDVGALANQRPRNSGQRRVMVSREFDQAWRAKSYPEDALASLGDWVGEEIESWWQSPAQRAGWRRVQLEVQTALVLECQDQGFPLHKRFCALSKRRIMTASYHRIVDIRANDRKRYDDAKPRIRRDNSKFAPMEQIVMDVKPIDNIVVRPDGSEAWPKMIAFHDTGTHRIFCWFVLLPPGEGVRQEHVIEAFLAMVSHPEWGFPKQLYRDNGTEFAVFDKIRSAITMIGGDASRSIINAKPYSGASKPIESKFSMLDRSVFSQMGGYAGSNRMNKKTQTVGKPPAPYPGSFDQFVNEALARILDVHHNMPLHSGPFKGQTSADAFDRHVQAGWRPVMVDTLALDASFCTMDSRKVDRGFVSIDGNRFSHPELPNGRKVTIARPWRRGALPLVDLPDLGWAALQPDMLHLPGDIAGAIEASRMQAKQDKTVTTLKRKVRKANPERNLATRLATLPSNAAPAPLMDVLLSSEAEKIAQGMRGGTAALQALPDAKARERERMMKTTLEIEAIYGKLTA